jgi:hypothetical protein
LKEKATPEKEGLIMSITVTYGLTRQEYATLTGDAIPFEGVEGDVEVHFANSLDAYQWVDRVEDLCGEMTVREAHAAGLIEAYQSTQLQP